MDGDLTTALAAERAIVCRAVDGPRDIDGGWVAAHARLPDIWHLNRVHLTGPARGLCVAGLEALSARALPDAPHDRVTFDDAVAADALWPEISALGWRRERSVVMVRAGDAPAGASEPGRPWARPIDPSSLEAFQPLAFAEDAAVTAISAELPTRLAGAQAVLRAGTAWCAFGAGGEAGVCGAGAGDRGLPASTATLYLDPDVAGRRVAFIDQVATLRGQRERGLGRAVMTACLRAAADWRADLVALFADAEDWPQVFYADLGFVTVGRQTVFHRDR